MKFMKNALIICALTLIAAASASAQGALGGDAALGEGWRLFNSGSFQEAYENFNRAFQNELLKESAGQGMVYSLSKLGRYDEALKIAESFPADHKIFGPMRASVTSQKAMAAFEAKNYPEAAGAFQKLIEMGNNEVSTKTLLGWSLFHQGKERQAVPVFLKAYQQSGDPKSAEAVLLACGRGGDLETGVAFASSLSESKDPMVAKQAGAFLYAHGLPITASQKDAAWERPYINAREPRIQAELVYRTKTGDAGLSRLTDVSAPITYSHPFLTGNELSFSIIPVSLDSGAAAPGPMAGSFNLKNTAKEKEVKGKVSAVVPQIAYKSEGAIRYSAALGATPISGEIAPAPTFMLKAQGGWFTASAYRQPVTESILSYTGMADPYGAKPWGRVLRAGAGAEFVFSFLGPHWFSIGGAHNSYSGENVADNSESNASVSLGRAFSTESWSVAAGVFGYMAKFDKNSNFFTLGHGGYFSPQNFTLGGVMLSMDTVPVDDFWAEVKLSASYMSFKNDASSKYPLSEDSALRAESFPSEEISQFGYSVKGRVYKLVGGNWMAGAGAALSKASDYTETIFQLTLRYHFGARKAALFLKD